MEIQKIESVTGKMNRFKKLKTNGQPYKKPRFIKVMRTTICFLCDSTFQICVGDIYMDKDTNVWRVLRVKKRDESTQSVIIVSRHRLNYFFVHENSPFVYLGQSQRL